MTTSDALQRQRAQLLKELEARAATVEDEIADLTVRIRARQSRAHPPSKTVVGGGSSDLGMMSFVAAQARASAQSDVDSTRIEELITSTLGTAARARDAERKAEEQHRRLIEEFGQEAVDAWKMEHEGAAEELIAERDAKLRGLQDFAELIAAEESGRASQGQSRVSVMQSGRAQLLRHILSDFYRKHAPADEAKVDDLVARVVGGPPTNVGGAIVGGVLWSEAELFEKLEAKYGAKVEVPDLI